MWSTGYSYPVKNIQSRRYYYFLTSERSEKGWFKFYSPEQIQLTTDEVKKMVDGDTKPMTAIPRDFIDKLNPSTDFVLKVSVTLPTGHTHNFSEFPLGRILTYDTLKYPNYLTEALMSGGECCLDLGDRLIVLNCDLALYKFNDPKTSDKLLRACHEAVYKATRSRWAEFTLETPEDAKKLTVKVSVSLSADQKNKFTSKEVGAFTLKEVAPPEPEEVKKS